MINAAKYRQAILYFLHECDNDELGKTKLMKLLYYLDFDHFEKYRTSVTGDLYKALPQGPVPESADSILLSMISNGLIAFQKSQRGPYEQHRYRPMADYDLSVFSDDERLVLETVADRWRDVTMNEIRDATHEEMTWKATKQGSRIPYTLAFHRHRSSMPSLEEREAMIWSAIGSQGLEGVELPYDEVSTILDEVLHRGSTRMRL